MITDEIKELVREHFPDFPIDETDRLPMGIYEWLVMNVWAPTRANWTNEQIVADFMNNEGRQTEPWPDFGAASERPHHPQRDS